MSDRWTLHVGDCRDVMRAMEPESIDSIVSDPPYGLSFMGKGWDTYTTDRRQSANAKFEEFLYGVFVEALRVAKPGCHLLAFGGTRTYHRLACAVEDAGWEVRDCLGWLYGSGFPKSHDVSKAIDREAGAEREAILVPTKSGNTRGDRGTTYATETHSGFRDISEPQTDSARQWQGWGTALKPAWEPIILARKPLRGTVAANVLEWGTGAVNVDGCRVATMDVIPPMSGKAILGGSSDGWDRPWKNNEEGLKRRQQAADIAIEKANTLGRWPANILHDGSEEVVGLFPSPHGAGARRGAGQVKHGEHSSLFGISGHESNGMRYGDNGSAARFFYCAKASKADRDEGCEGLEEREASVGDVRPCGDFGERLNRDRQKVLRSNHHPTVKPTDLMRYLCRLITPPEGLVFDPFTGSGSTGKAAMLEGFRFVGAELSEEYATIARARIVHAAGRERQMELALS